MKRMTLWSCFMALCFMLSVFLTGCGADSMDLGGGGGPTPNPTEDPKTITGKIVGKVTDATTGLPISEVTVSGGGANTVTTPDGAYTLTPIEGNRKIAFTAQNYEYKEVEINVVANQTQTLDVSLKSYLGYLTGRITDNLSGILENVKVTAYLNGVQVGESVTTDASGAYTLGVTPGIYTIVYEKRPYQTITVDNVVLTMNQQATANQQMQPSGNIWGFVRYSESGAFGVPGVKCELTSGGSVVATSTTEADGFYSFDMPTTAANYTVEYTPLAASGYYKIGGANATSQPANFLGGNNLLELPRVSYIAPTFKVSGTYTNSSYWASLQGEPKPPMYTTTVYIGRVGDKENVVGFSQIDFTDPNNYVLTIPQGTLMQPGSYTFWFGGNPNGAEDDVAHIDLVVTPGVDINNANVTAYAPTGIITRVKNENDQYVYNSHIRIGIYDMAGNPVARGSKASYWGSMHGDGLAKIKPDSREVTSNLSWFSHNLAANTNYLVVIFDITREYSPSVTPLTLAPVYIKENYYMGEIKLQKRDPVNVTLTVSGLLQQARKDNPTIDVPQGQWIGLYPATDDGKPVLSNLLASTQVTNTSQFSNFKFEVTNVQNNAVLGYSDLGSTPSKRLYTKLAICRHIDSTHNDNSYPAAIADATIDYTENVKLGTRTIGQQHETTVISVSPAALTLEYNDTSTVTVANVGANAVWQVTTYPTWLTVTYNRNSSNNTGTVTFRANTANTDVQRQGNIVIDAGAGVTANIAVTQKGVPTLKLTTPAQNPLNIAFDDVIVHQINITSNVEWTATITAGSTWLELDTTRLQDNNGNVRIRATSSNPSGTPSDPRTGTVTITPPAGLGLTPIVITVTQASQN